MKDVCVVGLGYIGLPTALMAATGGNTVHGVDINEALLEDLLRGKTKMAEEGFDATLDQLLRRGNLTLGTEAVPAEVFVICVQTPLDQGSNSADLTAVRNAVEGIKPHVRPGSLVILESTVPPLTLRNSVIKPLEELGFTPGDDLFCAFCAERVIPGNIKYEIVNNDRVVGGYDAESTRRAVEFYRTFVAGQLLETTDVTAELVKLMENTYRDVNIALANEFALVAEKLGVNVWDAIRLANHHPRVNIHQPGPGVGGHCLPIDPWFISEVDREKTPLIQLSRRINDTMPHHVVDMVDRYVAKPARIAVLGLTYKADVSDPRESPSFEVIEELEDRGYEVVAYDPFVPLSRWSNGSLSSSLKSADAAVFLVSHSEFRGLDPDELEPLAGNLIIDTRAMLDKKKFVNSRFRLVTLGNGETLTQVGE